MKLSIITINKNNAAGLEKTCRSVVCQTFEDFEWIVIDGASSDGSVDIIKKYSGNITYWISETDTGIYHGMNKGIRQARSEYCLFLNSGDCLIESETLKNVFDEINAYEPAGIYYSNWKKTNGEYIVIPNDIKITYFLNNELSHQNSIIRRTLFSHHGLYNEGLHIISDREFFMKECWIYKTPFIHLKTDISLFDTTGIGSTNVEKREKERQIVYKSIFGEFTDLIVSCNRVFCFFLRCYRFIFKRLRLTKTLIKKVFTSKNRV